MKTKIDESNYTVESHIYKATQKVRKLFFLIDPEIMKLENVVKYAKRNYIGYKLLIAKKLICRNASPKRKNCIAFEKC